MQIHPRYWFSRRGPNRRHPITKPNQLRSQMGKLARKILVEKQNLSRHLTPVNGQWDGTACTYFCATATR
jgi:hypothetical protein